MSDEQNAQIERTLRLLDEHYNSFHSVAEIAQQTGHPVPMDTRGWSQIVVSVLTGIKGIERKKGADLADGSDVKGANTWEAIDTPRFNGVIKAGTQAEYSDSLAYLDVTPYIFLVLWDVSTAALPRCRIWVVRPQYDPEFRRMCQGWYDAREDGRIKSTNFQLHPPRGKDINVITNTFGDLSYPLLFSSVRLDVGYTMQSYDETAMSDGLCTRGRTIWDILQEG